ncbi:hypothetical protein TcG_04039 [Trypanosoma cruzi]|uniref:tRNA-uridine aminocarboxypropyltransferase n=1 Tax=Trypanosoma cruzi Dm28c TaxID=1416333 RepID=V5BBX9_TRYCR|nr:hypothetical protein TCDM_06529 [Trypanosoma cruzi Dm28c]PBJ72649.1 hypothetical protein BCY84_15214 [Trypanosoma cruzi cruzi]RNF19856.1 hypothetical protein TcG_04039 [Trypanosoma cruzi]
MSIRENPYKESMRRLVIYAGLPDYGSTRTVTPPPLTGKEALYFQASESPEWKAHLLSIPREERHRASVRRRLCTRLWLAAQNDLCLWCWFTKSMCMCSRIEHFRAQILSDQLNSAVKVTMVMHAAEVMRATNSGHIAAFILGAPIRVWGVEEDDVYLQGLPAVDEEVGGLCTASLYPESNAILVENFVQNLQQGQKIHLLLSDGTWGQATSLNRHIPRHIPRVALDVDGSYKSLFEALRKRTRETGVSTLEATAMAMEQCLRGLNSNSTEGVSSVLPVLTTVMKEFVDLRCLLKFRDVCFAEGMDEVSGIIKKRDAYRRDASLERLRVLHTKADEDPEVRKQLLPPVLNYCYACDVAVGWHRMVEHVLGRVHQEGFKKGMPRTPGEKSRSCVCAWYANSLRGYEDSN